MAGADAQVPCRVSICKHCGRDISFQQAKSGRWFTTDSWEDPATHLWVTRRSLFHSNRCALNQLRDLGIPWQEEPIGRTDSNALLAEVAIEGIPTHWSTP